MAQNPHLARLDALEQRVTEIEASLSTERLPPILKNMRDRINAIEKRDTSNDLQIELEQLQKQIVELRAGVARIGTETDNTPVWSERVLLDSTVKDGFRVKEATVTVANAKGDDATREERRRRLAELIEDGQAVADQMNNQRDQVKRFA